MSVYRAGILTTEVHLKGIREMNGMIHQQQLFQLCTEDTCTMYDYTEDLMNDSEDTCIMTQKICITVYDTVDRPACMAQKRHV